MKFIFGRRDIINTEISGESCYLMTNGLGGFSSLTITGACSRNDHAVLMSCQKEEAPNHRYNMIHCLDEVLQVGERIFSLSSQAYTDGKAREACRYLTGFVYEDHPRWSYLAGGVELTKSIVLQPGGNTVGISYEIQNRSGEPVSLTVTPWLQFVPKGERLPEDQVFTIEEDQIIVTEKDQKNDINVRCGMISSRGRQLYYRTDGKLIQMPLCYRSGLYYAQDACDGRPADGCCAIDHCAVFELDAGEIRTGTLIYSTDGPIQSDFDQIREALKERRRQLVSQSGFKDDTARALALAADQFVVHRASTEKQTILAGYPFFEDWGRDTMIALTGCCLSTRQYDRARSILRTFMKYCRRGLMPNLFPEGMEEPKYNTVDAALLFILAVYGYYRRTGDRDFVAECGPVMEEIVRWYVKGTDFGIGMDEDGLIRAGKDFDQVTWMDVRIGDILPTPRHGKPVEINAYWYNVLRIMEVFRNELRELRVWEEMDYGKMAERTERSFREIFWNEDTGCLKDVISWTEADGLKDVSSMPEADCQIRCNQIWAVAQPFSVLSPAQERQVVETVFQRLYTPLGMRTLDPADPQFKPVYGGELLKRDLAYHQGTVWVYPLGAYYLAWLKVSGFSKWAAAQVRRQLEGITAALREGCIGQLPEIYDGLDPAVSRGCFAQAWSVGEILRVYEALERIETGEQWCM